MKQRATGFDILKEFTKDEIIAWAREVVFDPRQIRRSHLLYIRWERMSKALEKAENEHLAKRVTGLERRDEYARQLNASNDSTERLLLLKLMRPYDEALKAYLQRVQELDKQSEKIDLIYKEMEKERANERRC